MHASIYEPAEDSYLMCEALTAEISKLLKINSKLKFLEVGCGSGINLQTAKTAGIKIDNILGSDVNKKAVEYCCKLGFNCIKSDLFENIKGKFDLIAFNPPYLLYDKNEPKESRAATTGGKKGNEIIIKFLKQAGRHLSKKGKVLIITSSLSQSIDFEKLGFKAKIILDKKLFFEKLVVWECLKI